MTNLFTSLLLVFLAIPFVLSEKWSAMLPNNGDTTPSATDDTDFGSTDITVGIIPKTYTIENTGIANLTITAVDGTTWSNVNDDEDLRFLEIRCGNESLNYTWIDNSGSGDGLPVENAS